MGAERRSKLIQRPGTYTGTRAKGLTDIRIGVLFCLEFLLYFFEQTDDSAGVADIAILLKVGADLEGLLAPERPVYTPVERVLERAAVEVLLAVQQVRPEDKASDRARTMTYRR
jgi:hypothetical protein